MALNLESEPEDRTDEKTIGKELMCCKCGCGRSLIKHGPNDRDDTHRGLQYPIKEENQVNGQ